MKTKLKPVDYVFSASSARSGSTLLAFLLNAHDQIASIAEMEGLIDEVDAETFPCSCGELIKECPFWNDVTQHMQANGYEFSYSNFDTFIRLNSNRIINKIQTGTSRNKTLDNLRNSMMTSLPIIGSQLMYQVERNIALSNAILDITGKLFLFDTSKNVGRIHYLNTHELINMRVIHLTRDPRGVLASEIRRNPSLDIHYIATKWLKENKKIEFQCDRLDDEHYIHIRYEDLANEPLATINRIFEFLGVDTVHSVPEFRSVPHHIIGAKMRLQSSTEIQLDERWKTELTEAQMSSIMSVTSDAMQQYGYTSKY